MDAEREREREATQTVEDAESFGRVWLLHAVQSVALPCAENAKKAGQGGQRVAVPIVRHSGSAHYVRIGLKLKRPQGTKIEDKPNSIIQFRIGKWDTVTTLAPHISKEISRKPGDLHSPTRQVWLCA